ncbi:MAG: hypothetical protein K9G70_01285 [Prolixibacteraceae bacterium]|nr:hypothetical protein [Prolixibacteraceae bacterium]
MDIIEKRDFIHSCLHQANENTINEFFEKLQKEQVLKAKLGNRAQKSENDIESGRVFSRAEIEERTSNLGLK